MRCFKIPLAIVPVVRYCGASRVSRLTKGVQMRRQGHSTVYVSKADVCLFADRWPCFGPRCMMRFDFAANGDLVALYGDEGMDEQGVAALSQDALTFLRRA